MTGFFQLPPLHPILVHFPVALLPVTFACDLLGRFTGRRSLTHAGWWALVFATAAAPLTAASGWLWLGDMDGMTHHTEMVIHQWLGTAVPLFLLLLTFWRYRFHRRDKEVSLSYLAAAATLVAAVTVQGHIGGMMTFGNAPSMLTTPTSQPTTQHTQTQTKDDGWSDSIRVKEHRK